MNHIFREPFFDHISLNLVHIKLDQNIHVSQNVNRSLRKNTQFVFRLVHFQSQLKKMKNSKFLAICKEMFYRIGIHWQQKEGELEFFSGFNVFR